MTARSGGGRRVLVTADDFGLSEAVNEGIERAHRDGVLGRASLMVAGAAAADAVERARRMPTLAIGLHLVLVEGPAVLPPAAIPDLVGADGWFPSDQTRLGPRYARPGRIRRQLAAEIAAQFDAFAATGLPLAHADAHKHMHLHPVVGALVLRAGRDRGLPRLRVPYEPPALLAAAGTRVGVGARLLAGWTRMLRGQARRAGVATPDRVVGLAWSGGMTEARLLRLLPHLPGGETELYFHPAAARDALLDRLMPGYRHEEELAALLSPRVRQALTFQ